jgi:hypothetical protein
MKNLILIVLSCSFALAAWAQPNTPTTKTGRVGIGLYYNPSFTYRSLSASTPSETFLKEQRNQNEIFGLSQAAGMTFAYRIGERWRVQLGVLYGDRTYRSKKENLEWPSGTDGVAQEAYMSFHHYYGDIPLKVTYKFLEKGRFDFFAGVGASAAIFGQYNRNTHIRTESGWEVSNKDQNYFVNFDEVNFFALVDAGIEYRLSKAFKLSLALTGQIPLKPSNSNLDLKEHLYSVGLGIGFIYNPLVKVK